LKIDATIFRNQPQKLSANPLEFFGMKNASLYQAMNIKGMDAWL